MKQELIDQHLKFLSEKWLPASMSLVAVPEDGENIRVDLLEYGDTLPSRSDEELNNWISTYICTDPVEEYIDFQVAAMINAAKKQHPSLNW